jgi:hypothetical protein
VAELRKQTPSAPASATPAAEMAPSAPMPSKAAPSDGTLSGNATQPEPTTAANKDTEGESRKSA